MGTLLSKVCGGAPNPLLSLNDTCQRLRCLMACCGGNVNVVTRGDADFTDASAQTDESYCKKEEKDSSEEKEEEEGEDVKETSV